VKRLSDALDLSIHSSYRVINQSLAAETLPSTTDDLLLCGGQVKLLLLGIRPINAERSAFQPV
jgi:hypothetical protein